MRKTKCQRSSQIVLVLISSISGGMINFKRRLSIKRWKMFIYLYHNLNRICLWSSAFFFKKYFFINISICKVTVHDTGVMKNKDARERNQSFVEISFWLITIHHIIKRSIKWNYIFDAKVISGINKRLNIISERYLRAQRFSN